MRISRLVYISERNAAVPADMADLIRKSRSNNARVGVTGFLISDGEYFAQALEGPRWAVTHIYNHVAKDPRHRRLHIVSCMDVGRRLFPNWPMGLMHGIPLEVRKALLSNFNIESFDPNSTPVEHLLYIFAMMAADAKSLEQSAMVLKLAPPLAVMQRAASFR